MEGKLNMSPVEVLVNLWRHECERVFCDKLTTNKVKPTPRRTRAGGRVKRG